LNGTVTTTTGLTIGTVQYYNPTYTGNTAVTVNRWQGVTAPKSGGTSFTNFEANTAMQSPAGATYPAGTLVGLNRNTVTPLYTNQDPNYFSGATAPNATGGAWLLGQITFNATAAGSSTIALTAGSQEITKSGLAGNTTLSAAYTFGSATINVTTNIFGDLNGDGKLNDLDLGILLGNWQQNVAPSGGELNNSPPVNDLDLGLLLGAWAPGAGSVAPVPEPSAALLLGLGAIGLALRVRKKVQS